MDDDIGYLDDLGGFDSYEYSNYSLWNISNATDSGDYDLNSGWCEAGEHEFTIKMFQTCVFCLIFLLGVVGNCLVIATFALYGRHRLRSMTDVFLFHLALADLLLLLTLPLQAIDTHLGWILPVTLCKVMRACYAINTYSGLLLLACISVDRYLVVAQAQEMLRLRGRIFAAGTVAAVGVWLVAVLVSLPEILFSGVSGSGSEAFCGMLKSGIVKMATNGAIIAVFCVSLLVMVTCYSLIARMLWEGQAHRRGKQWHRQRTLKLMVALVLVFLVFQLPYTVVLSRKMAGQFCALLLEYITCTLAYTRCCLNPILYALVGVRFRNDVLRLIHDSGCPCGLQLVPQLVSSVSPSSPAVTVLSACSPTSAERSHFSCDAVPPVKSQFPRTH
ncbi:C-C chemokine receptor type 10 [Chaetodon trifascialis]|uniref:C-C chemokine receptor type 10 n=1 Tax=Chaetodon trifascialis TaxID=109706 RepID=UPI003991981C